MKWFEPNANSSAQAIEEKIAELTKQLADVEQKLRQARDKERFVAEETTQTDVFG
jgi:prefoldin subunit 5